MPLSAKIEALNFLIFMYGKLIRLRASVEATGEDAKILQQKERDTAEIIERMRSALMTQWDTDADALLAELRRLNRKAQRKMRNLDDTVNKARKVQDIAKVVDQALVLAKTVV